MPNKPSQKMIYLALTLYAIGSLCFLAGTCVMFYIEINK